jgi:hypothetical protein
MEESKSLFATMKSLGRSLLTLIPIHILFIPSLLSLFVSVGGGQATFSNLQFKMRMATSVPDLIEEITSQANESGCVSLKMVTGIFQKYGVILESKESELISRRYISPNGSIQVLKLLNALDIGVPSDYLEIDKFQDPLPQPYRMISKVLELEIIDRAWLEILRKYPEVQEEIPGRNMILRRNKNLDIECFPSNQSERSQNITAVTGCEECILTVNEQGAFSILELETGKFLHTLQVFPEELAPPEHLQYLITTPSSILPPLTSCRVAVLKIKLLPKPPPEPELEESEKDKKAKAAAAAKKAPPPAKGKASAAAPEEEEKKPSSTHRCSVALIDLLNIHPSCPLSAMQCNLVYSFDFLLLSGQVYSEFSSDGRCLLVSHGPEIAYFKFPPVDSAEELFSLQKMGRIIETDADTLEDGADAIKSPSSARIAEPKPIEPQSRWVVMEEVQKQVTAMEQAQLSPLRNLSLPSEGDSPRPPPSLPRVQSCHFFSFGSAFNWEDPPASAAIPPVPPPSSGAGSGPGAGNRATSFRSNSSLYHNGLAVFLEDFQRWFIFGLRTAPPPSPPPPPAPISPRADAKKDKAAGAAAAAVVPPEAPDDPSKRIWVLDLLRHFPLSSSVTTVEFDAKRSLLILGQGDGSISLWDLKGMMLISLSTKHHSAVTSLCLTQGVASYFLVSGDANGVLCFHKIHTAASLTSDLNPLPSSSSSASTSPILSAELMDFRLDFTRESVVRIWPIQGSGVSVVVVQISSGRLVAYDADGAELLGRLSLTSGVLGLRMEYSLALTQDCIISNPSPPLPPAALGADSPAPIAPVVGEQKSRSQLWNDRSAIASGCSNGFCAFFFRSNLKAVLSSFNIAKFLTFFYPGISSLSKASTSAKGKVLTPLALYKLLQPSQRMDPKLKSSQVPLLNEAPPPEQTKTQAKISRTGSRPTFTSSGSSNNLLTTAKLKELQKSYQVLDSSSPASLLPALADFSSSRITSPKTEFEKSTRASQNERIKRKMQVVSSLKQLSALL